VKFFPVHGIKVQFCIFFFAALPDVIHAVAKYEIGHEPREIFFFREGSIVMWNISDLECGNLLQFLRNYEQNHYTKDLIHSESELMHYTYADFGYLLFIITITFMYILYINNSMYKIKYKSKLNSN